MACDSLSSLKLDVCDKRGALAGAGTYDDLEQDLLP
jgi:hypothetical protein